LSGGIFILLKRILSMHKLTLISISLFAVLLVFGCTQQPLNQQQTYTNQNFGISFNYDSNLYFDSSASGDSFATLTKDLPDGDICAITISKNLISDLQDKFRRDMNWYGDSGISALSLDTNLTITNYRTYISNYQPKDFNIEMTEDKYVEVSGLQMWRSTKVSHMGKDLNPKTVDLVGIRGSYFYEIKGGTYNSNNFDGCSRYIEGIISSFKFI